jgi:dCMP deaminase
MKSEHRRVAVVAYVATPHRGYLEFFEKYRHATLFALGGDMIDEFTSLARHLPANKPEHIQAMVGALSIFSEIRILKKGTVDLVKKYDTIVMPDEDVSHAIAEKYFAGVHVFFDGSWRLRWHWDAVAAKQQPHDVQELTRETAHQELMLSAFQEAARSSDWWRQIGSLLVRNGKPLLRVFNKHFPSEQSPYINGDPRSQFDPGVSIELSSALHSEVALISEAARRGIKTEGCDVYVTTFPCPPCAYAVANAGIRTLYFAEGYSRLEGQEALESRNVRIVKVLLDTPPPQ